MFKKLRKINPVLLFSCSALFLTAVPVHSAPSATDCNEITEEGTFTFDSTDKAFYFCENNTRGWESLSLVSPDTTPDILFFADTSALQNNTRESNILQITGITSAPVSITVNAGSPSDYGFRICSDSSCNSVTHAYGQAGQTIDNFEYLQLFLDTPAGSGTYTLDITVGTLTDSWTVTVSGGP